MGTALFWSELRDIFRGQDNFVVLLMINIWCFTLIVYPLPLNWFEGDMHVCMEMETEKQNVDQFYLLNAWCHNVSTQIVCVIDDPVAVGEWR